MLETGGAGRSRREQRSTIGLHTTLRSDADALGVLRAGGRSESPLSPSCVSLRLVRLRSEDDRLGAGAGAGATSSSLQSARSTSSKTWWKWRTSSEKTPAGMPSVGEKTMPTCGGRGAKPCGEPLEQEDAGREEGERATYVSQGHLVHGRVLDDQDEVRGEGSEEAVVGRGQLGDQLAELGHSLAGVAQVWERQTPRCVSLRDLKKGRRGREGQTDDGEEAHVELAREETRRQVAQEGLWRAELFDQIETDCSLSKCNDLEQARDGVWVVALAVLQELDVALCGGDPSSVLPLRTRGIRQDEESHHCRTCL